VASGTMRRIAIAGPDKFVVSDNHELFAAISQIRALREEGVAAGRWRGRSVSAGLAVVLFRGTRLLPQISGQDTAR